MGGTRDLQPGLTSEGASPHPASAIDRRLGAVSGWLNGVTYGMQIVPSALLPATDRLAGQDKVRPVVRERWPGMSLFRVIGPGRSTAGRGYGRGGEIAGVMGLCRVGQARRLAIGH